MKKCILSHSVCLCDGKIIAPVKRGEQRKKFNVINLCSFFTPWIGGLHIFFYLNYLVTSSIPQKLLTCARICIAYSRRVVPLASSIAKRLRQRKMHFSRCGNFALSLSLSQTFTEMTKCSSAHPRDYPTALRDDIRYVRPTLLLLAQVNLLTLSLSLPRRMRVVVCFVRR